MVKALFTLFFLCTGIGVVAQSSVFVLVDVSGSVPKSGSSIQNEAKQLAKDFCMGKFNSAQYSDWEWIGPKDPLIESMIAGTNTQPLLDPAKDGYLMIMPLGEKDTYRQYRVERLQQAGVGLDEFFTKHYPTVFRDKYTYVTVAIASAASVAKGTGIDSYYMVLITDELSHTQSISANYTREEEELIAAWGTANAQNVKLATLKNRTKREFQISFHKVQVSRIPIVPKSPGPDNFDKKELNLIRPVGKQASPEPVSGGSISAIWNCLGCDTTTEFTIRLSPVGAIQGESAQTRKTRDRTTRFVVGSNGVYRLTLSADEFGSKTGFVRVSGVKPPPPSDGGGEGGGGGFWVLLLLALLAGGAYLFFRNRQEKSFQSPRDENERERPSREIKRKDGGDKGSGNDNPSGFW